MKKFILTLLAVVMFTAPVMARPNKHHNLPSKHPAPVVVHHSHKPKHHVEALSTLAAGLIGFTLGNISSNSTNYTNYTITNTGQECFVVVSKSSGNVTQKCVEGNNQVLYVD